MGLVYERNTTITYYCPFVTIDSMEPMTITNPTLTIRHVDDTNTLITDVDEAPMTLADENVYFFKWLVPISAFLGEYNVECQAIVDGFEMEHNRTVQVVD